MARSCPTSLTALAALCEPCYCELCDGSPKLLGAPCTLCGEKRWGCRSLPCWCDVPYLCACGGRLLAPSHEQCQDCWLADHRRQFHGATALQRLWRGYKERQTIQKRHAEEVRACTPIWRSYDDQYRMYALCQTLMAELKKDDASWDPTQEPYYIWMMEHGPMLEEWETFLRRRGWVRPKKTHINGTVLKRLLQGVFDSCGLTGREVRCVLALVDAFTKTR